HRFQALSGGGMNSGRTQESLPLIRIHLKRMGQFTQTPHLYVRGKSKAAVWCTEMIRTSTRRATRQVDFFILVGVWNKSEFKGKLFFISQVQNNCRLAMLIVIKI